MLEKIKLALRIRNNAADDDIQENIDAALFDLRIAGVLCLDESDPLIIQAVKLYCKANYGLENKDYEKYQKAYCNLRDSLALCGDYNVE